MNSLFYSIEVFTHYLIMIRYFLNEYYMASILHYMSTEAVKSDQVKTVNKWIEYHWRRDLFMNIFKIGMILILTCFFIVNFTIIGIDNDWKEFVSDSD